AARGVRREVVPEPLLLGGPGAAAADRGAVAVQHVDPPRPGGVGVVALRGIARRGPEVAVVARGARGVVVVVARDRARPRLDPWATPARVVAVRELRGGAVVVDVVAGREDGAADEIEDAGRGLVAAGAAGRDVAGADEDERRPGGDRRRGCGARRQRLGR